MNEFVKNELVWLGAGHGYSVPAVVIDTEPIMVRLVQSNHVMQLDNAVRLTARKKFNADVEDLVEIPDECESALLYSLQKRFEKKRIYTKAGEVLLALNPYEHLSIYDDSVIKLYRNQPTTSMPAHIFSMAENVLCNVKNRSRSEMIFFSGESGSGKTANLLQAARYIVKSSKRQGVTSEQITAIHTIIDAFAGAKTLKNENATRVGYLIELLYRNESIEGVALRHLLPLELSRVVYQKQGERNFNVFYQMCAGLEQSLRQKFGLKESHKYFYLNQGKCVDNESEELEKFADLREAFKEVGFTDDQQSFIFRTLATILHIGNLFFRPRKVSDSDEQMGVEIGNDSEIKWSAYLLEVDFEQWSAIFTSKTMTIGEETASAPLTINQALDVRDSLAQLIYDELFHWIMTRISCAYQCPNHSSSIALLDYYGFERYNNNMFEQFCVNLVSERFESFYVQKIFKEVKYDYEKEEIEIDYQMPSSIDNERITELLFKRPDGLLPLLDDECKFPKASDESYLQRCNLNHLDKSIYGKARAKDRLEFAIKHFAGQTFYSVQQFIEKNRRQISKTAIATMAESQNTSVAQIFRNHTFNGKVIAQDEIVYVAQQYNRSTKAIVEKMSKSVCHFVRCLRSNSERQAGRFCEQTVVRQLHSLAVLDTIKIRRHGYPIKQHFDIFAARYRCLLPADVARCQTTIEIVNDVLEQQGNKFQECFRIGKTAVCLKERIRDHLENIRERTTEKAAITIQKHIRMMIARREYLKKRKAAIVLQSGLRGWKARRIVEQKRAETRKAIDLETRQARRMNVYADAEADKGDAVKGRMQSLEASVAGVQYLDLPEQVQKRLAVVPQGKCAEIRTVHYYTPFTTKIGRPQIALISLEEFAERSFKGHLVEARREPIATPFLPKDTEEEFNEALLIFKLILRYMNDTQLSNEQLVILAKHIMQKGIDMPEQRDEIYVQICNQTYRNRVKANAEKAWTLMLCACNSFPPSIHIFPMLMHYFQTVPQNLSSLLIDGLLRRIRNKETSSNRMLASTVLEQSAFKHQQPAVLRVRCPHDQEVDFEADSWMTSEELAKKFLRTKGIGEPEGWSISVDDPEWTIQGAGNHYVYDVIAQFEEPGAAMNDGPFVAFINKGNFKPSQPSTKRTNNSPKGASTMVMAQRSLPRMRRSSLERKTEVSKPPTPPPHHMQAYSERRRDTKIHLGEQIYGNDEQRPPLPQHQSLVAEGLSSSTLNRRYTNGTIDRKVRMQDGCETLPNGVAAPIYGRISNNEIYQRGALDRREPRMRSEFDQSMLRPIEQPQSPPDGQTMKRYRRQQQQFSEIERHDPRPQFAYVPQQFAMPVMPAQVQFMPFMLPTTSFVPQRAVETWPQEPVRNEKSNREKVNTSVVMNDDRVYREKQPEQRIDDLHGESRTEIYGRASSRTPIGSQNTRDEQRRPPSDYSTMSISSRIRRMQIPSKNSDVDKFLDAVFEQVLPPHELERSDERAISTSVIAASIKGGLNGPVTASEREMRIVDNDGTMQSAQSVAGQYVQPGFVNYAAQPVMMMMPVDGRMFMQQQQQTINSETIPDGRSVSQMTSVSSAIQPVPMVIPSIIPSNVMMCISPTPGALSCLSPVPIKSEQVDELPQDNDRTLSPTPMVYSPVVAPNNFRDQIGDSSRPSTTMRIRSSPLPESAQSPTNLDENSRLGQLNPTSIKARYVGPTHPETNEGLRSPDMPRRVTSSIKQIQQDAVRKRPQPVQLNVRGYRNENPYYSNTTNFVRYESPYGQHSESIPPPLPQRIQMDGMQQVQNGSGLSYRSPETVSYYQESPVITHQHSVHYNLQPTYSPPPRETKGLQRLSQDEYREPVIVGDTLNSERLQPGKLPLPTPVPQTYEIERDAIRKLKEKARHLPPPVDETRFVRPAPKKEVIEIQYKPLVRRKEPRNEQREVTVNEPKESPAPLRPPPRVTYQSEEPEASQIGEWVYESDVLRSDVKESRLRAQQLHGNLYARGVPAVIAPMPSDSSSSPQIANIQKNLYEKSAPPKQREKPAVQYVKQPWTLTIRKELFFPYEQLDDVQEIDLVFSQIIADCRKQIPYRIRNYERDAISQILRSNNVPPAALDHPEEIAVEVKMHIIETVRKWPLYFCRLYAVVEERENDSVNRLLGVGESGVRLISRNIENTKEPLSISDHFDYRDIAELHLEGSHHLKLVTRKGLSVLLRTEQAEQIRLIIEKYITGSGKVKTFVRATADYITNEPNLLSFKKGEVIQIISRNDSSAPASDNWLYGRIGNQYGNLPANYVQPLDAPLSNDALSEINSLSATFDEAEYGEHVPLDMDTTANGDGKGDGKYTMMHFAMLYFRRPKHMLNGDSLTAQRKKKDWTWKDIADKVKYTDRPISHSLLRLDSNEADKLAQEAFLCIMRYMGDENLKRGQTLTDCVYELLMICHQYQPMRDEVYCQIIRQTTNNKSPRTDSSIKGWRLFSILTAYFDCSQVLKPYVFKYLADMANDPRRAYHGTALTCLQNLAKTFKYGGRKFLLSGREIEATTMGKNLKRQLYHLPGGHKKVVNTKAVTVAEEIIQELCMELNIRSPAEQQEFCLCYILESESTMKLLSNDEYILDVCTELEHQKKDYFLLLKRTVWIHPLRLDNNLYIDVMFFQVVPDYMEGLLIAPKATSLSAASLDDIVRLGAYLHLSDKDGPSVVSPQNVLSLLPKSILEARPAEQWAERINKKLAEIDSNMSPIEARAAFLELLEKWPLFGSTFFYMRNIIDGDKNTGECLLAVNKYGLKFLTLSSRETIAEFTLSQVLSTNKYSTANGMFLDIKVGNLIDQRTITLETDKGGEISRLLGQYIYVDSENRGFIGGSQVEPI